MRKITAVISAIIITGFLCPAITSANIGVGIGPGKIELEKPVKPGGLYKMPPFTVINTGDEAGEYEVSIEYQDGQSKLWPARDWFVLNPGKIHLNPGQSQSVDISVNIPIKAKPGEYFAFLSAHPVSNSNVPGKANMEISAAAKIYFAISPANVFQALYYRTVFLLSKYAPWSYVLLTIILGSILLVIGRHFISFNIGIERKRKRVRGKMAKETPVQKTEEINKILNKTLYEVETYAAQLSEKKLDAVFLEAQKHKQDIIEYFYHNNLKVLTLVSPELRSVLMFSRQGLEQTKLQGRDVYEEIRKIVVKGIVE